MTAQPHPNHQLLTRIIALEDKVNTEFDVLRAKVEEYRLLCENKHLHTLVVNKEQRITQLEQELEACQKKKNKDLEEKLIDLEKRCEEMKVQLSTVNLASNNNVEPQVNITNRLQQLFRFTRHGNIAEVKSIIATGVDVNAVDGDGYSPLHYAAEHGHVTVCEHLLDKGTDVNVKSCWGGATPLHKACAKGHIDVIKLLVAHGASGSVRDSNGRTPLYYAQRAGHTSVWVYL